MIRLVLTDMDNAPFPLPVLAIRLETWVSMTRRAIDAIHACQEEGIDFGPASGRDRGEVASFFGNDASCYNTGVMVSRQKVYFLGEVVFEKTLPTESLRKVESLVAPLPGCAFITYRDNNFGDWVSATREAGHHVRPRVHVRRQAARARRDARLPVVKAGIIVRGPRAGARPVCAADGGVHGPHLPAHRGAVARREPPGMGQGQRRGHPLKRAGAGARRGLRLW